MIIANLWINKGYSVKRVISILSINKSTYYYRKNSKLSPDKEEKRGRKIPGYSLNKSGEKVKDQVIRQMIERIKEDEKRATYGYKRVTEELKREEDLIINKKKIRRIMGEMNLLQNKKIKKVRDLSIRCKNRKVTDSNQLWESDIKYSAVEGTGETVYILSIIDVFDREIIAHRSVKRCTGEVAKEVLIEALYNRDLKEDPKGLIVRTDNGSQYISNAFSGFCQDEKIIHERIPVASPNYNAHIESFHRSFEEEWLSRILFMTFESFELRVKEYMEFYNEKRIHSSLNYIPPKEFYFLNNSELKEKMVVNL